MVAYELLFAFSVAFLAAAAAFGLAGVVREKLSAARLRAAAKPFSDRWVESLERQVGRLPFLALKGRSAAVAVVTAVPAGFLAGMVVFRHFVLAALCAFLVVLAMEQFAAHRKRLHAEKVSAQLAAAVRLFAAEFAVTPQVERGLAAVAAQIPPPVGAAFDRARRSLLHRRKDPDAVFADLAKDLGTEHGVVFAQLLRLARRGAVKTELFHELAARATLSRELSVRSRAETSGEKLLALIVTMAPLPLYLVLRAALPEAADFLSHTFAGRLTVFTSFAAAVIFAVLDRLVGGEVA